MSTQPDSWEACLDCLGGEERIAAEKWYNSRPPSIQALIRRFPPGTVRTIKGRTAYLIGFKTTGLTFSYTNPRVDYDEAVATRFFVCSDHLNEEDKP
jgi:hypothetical protein